jgi:hypothetical protein
MTIDVIWYCLTVLIIIEVGYQAVNMLVKKLNNIPIPNSVEREEE